MKLLRNLALMTATVLLSCGIADIQVAQAGSLYKLTFYDTTDTVVGEGSFETSDTPYEITIPRTSPFPPFEITAADQLFEVTSFSATVLEQQWNLSNLIYGFNSVPLTTLLWSGNETNQPRALEPVNSRRSNPLEPVVYPQWYFAKGKPVSTQFEITAPSSFQGTNKMGWFQSGFGSNNTSGSQVNGGYVTATAIPEPMTIAGLALAGAGLAATRRRLAMSKK